MSTISKEDLRILSNDAIDKTLEDVFEKLKEAANEGKFTLLLHSDILSDDQFNRLQELGYSMYNNKALNYDTITW